MNLNQKEAEAWQTQAYGMTDAEMETDLTAQASRFHPPTPDDWLILSLSILSDAQEEVSRGGTERARQYINKAKWCLLNKVRNGIER